MLSEELLATPRNAFQLNSSATQHFGTFRRPGSENELKNVYNTFLRIGPGAFLPGFQHGIPHSARRLTLSLPAPFLRLPIKSQAAPPDRFGAPSDI